MRLDAHRTDSDDDLLMVRFKVHPAEVEEGGMPQVRPRGPLLGIPETRTVTRLRKNCRAYTLLCHILLVLDVSQNGGTDMCLLSSRPRTPHKDHSSLCRGERIDRGEHPAPLNP